MPKLNLAAVDELINARRVQHGYRRGAPPIIGGTRVGNAINVSCIVMLSALLQGFIEELFVGASRRGLKSLDDYDSMKKFRDTMWRWGNPSPENIERLFNRLGLVDVFDGLRWQRTTRTEVVYNLKRINDLRNKIAHAGRLAQPVTLAEVVRLRNFAKQFGDRFGRHIARLYLRKN
jgi:RiboL-PSP-HEPN